VTVTGPGGREDVEPRERVVLDEAVVVVGGGMAREVGGRMDPEVGGVYLGSIRRSGGDMMKTGVTCEIDGAEVMR